MTWIYTQQSAATFPASRVPFCLVCYLEMFRVIEMSLAHSIKDATERAYRRGNLAEKHQRLMQDWADYCDGNLWNTIQAGIL